MNLQISCLAFKPLGKGLRVESLKTALRKMLHRVGIYKSSVSTGSSPERMNLDSDRSRTITEVGLMGNFVETIRTDRVSSPNMRIMTIQLGTIETSVCVMSNDPAYKENNYLVEKVSHQAAFGRSLKHRNSITPVVIEEMTNPSRRFGGSCRQTCYFIGRFICVCETNKILNVIFKRHEYGRYIVINGFLSHAGLRSAPVTIWERPAKKSDPSYIRRSGSYKQSVFALAKYHEHRLLIVTKTLSPVSTGMNSQNNRPQSSCMNRG